MKKDLNNSVIYKIFCKNEEVKDLYVGQTTDFTRRKYAHKRVCFKKMHEYNNKNKYTSLYNIINLNGGWDNWKMEVIEKYPCNSKEELDNREMFWIVELNASLNVTVCKTTKEKKSEWYFNHREIIRKKQKEYNDAIKKLYTVNFDDLEDNPEWFRNNVLNRQLKI